MKQNAPKINVFLMMWGGVGIFSSFYRYASSLHHHLHHHQHRNGLDDDNDGQNDLVDECDPDSEFNNAERDWNSDNPNNDYDDDGCRDPNILSGRVSESFVRNFDSC